MGWSWSIGGIGSGMNGTDQNRRGYTAGWFALELDNNSVPVGFCTQIDGAQFRSEAIKNYTGKEMYVAQYTGKPKYEDITIGIGMPNSYRLFSWVKSSLENRPERHSGALVCYDNFASKLERSRRVFEQALISEITFPGLDAANNQPANITLKIAPELLRYERGGSRLNVQQARDEDVKQKRWSCSNFGLKVDGFWGEGARRNAKIESFTVKQSILDNPAGNRLETYRDAGRIEYPNIVVTFDEPQMNTWYKWYRESTIDRRISRRTGAMTWLTPDLRQELMRLNLSGISLLNLEVERYEAGKTEMARAKATFCVEGMDLQRGLGNV
jgi:hypothetical protein